MRPDANGRGDRDAEARSHGVVEHRTPRVRHTMYMISSLPRLPCHATFLLHGHIPRACGLYPLVSWCVPNARFQARRRAGARDERTLFAVACKPLFGQEEDPLALMPPPLHGPTTGRQPQPLPLDQGLDLLPCQAAPLHALHLTRTRCSLCSSRVVLRAFKPLSDRSQKPSTMDNGRNRNGVVSDTVDQPVAVDEALSDGFLR